MAVRREQGLLFILMNSYRDTVNYCDNERNDCESDFKNLFLITKFKPLNAAELQINFLKEIKNQRPSHLALVDAIAE